MTGQRSRVGILISLTDRVGRAAYYVGDFDRKVSDAIDVAVEPGDSVLDIGANVGLTALRLASRVGSRGRVRAFEPNPTMLRYLRESIQRSKLQDIVEVLPYALGRVGGTATLRVPFGNAGMGSLALDCEDVAEEHVVNVVRLDDVWKGQRPPRIDFIKIDVEGFESDVLEGARRTIVTPNRERYCSSTIEHRRSPSSASRSRYCVSWATTCLRCRNTCCFRVRCRPTIGGRGAVILSPLSPTIAVLQSARACGSPTTRPAHRDEQHRCQIDEGERRSSADDLGARGRNDEKLSVQYYRHVLATSGSSFARRSNRRLYKVRTK